MNELKDFFDIKKNACDSDKYKIVEDCSETEGTLIGYSVVCPTENVEPMLAWARDNCKDIGGYISEYAENGSLNFVMELLKPTVGIDSLTDEFIVECGSVQAFLDKYGNEGSEITLGVNTDAEKHDSIDADSLGDEEEEPAWEGTPSCLAGLEEEVKDVVDDAESVESSESSEDGFLDLGALEAPIEEPEQEPEEEQEEQEPKPEQEPEEEQEEDSESVPETVPEREESFGEPEIECDGIAVPFMKATNGKIFLKFSDLTNLVNFVTEASSQLEEEDIKGTKILNESEKIEAAKLLDQYSPAVVKEFVLQYVLHAESSTDYIRITSILDSFCEYIEENKIDTFK